MFLPGVTGAVASLNRSLVPPCDYDSGSNIKGAYSASRKMRGAYAGSFYALTSDKISTVYDQSATVSSTKNYVQTTAGVRPLLQFAGPRSRPVIGLNAANWMLTNGADLSSFGSNSTMWAAVSCIFAGLGQNDDGPYASMDLLWGDGNGEVGITQTITPATTLQGYNYDGNEDHAAASYSINKPMVVEWYHSGGNVGIRVNGGSAVTAASSNTTDMSGLPSIGHITPYSHYCNVKIFEQLIGNAIPTNRAAMVTNMMMWCGAQ